MGPDKSFPFSETSEKWEGRVRELFDKIKSGWGPPPLIVTDFWEEVAISDGNHRKEALVRNGQEKYWVIFYLKNKDNKKKILEQTENKE